MQHSFLERLALFACHHYRAIFIVVGVAVMAGVGLASQLRFETDVLALLPKNEPAVETYREALEEFGSLDFLVVAVRVPEGAILDPYEEFVDALGTELSTVEHLSEVEYRLGDLEDLVKVGVIEWGAAE